MEYNGNNYASKGVGTAGLTLGIIGTALATLAGGGSLLSAATGNNGNGGNNCNGNSCNNGSHSDEVCKLRGQVAKLESEKYTDTGILDLRDRIAALNKDVIGQIIELDKGQSVLKTQVECLNQKLDYEQKLTEQKINCCCEKNDLKLAAVRNDLEGAIKLESERRECGDRNLYSYVNATFVPGKLSMPLSSICPPAQPATTTTTTPAA